MKGRGALRNTPNPFVKEQQVRAELTAIDDWEDQHLATTYIPIQAKSIVNKVDSSDIPFDWNMNPYQGCEHGCIYCYARNSFEYGGYSAGLDFEQKILVKDNAASLLQTFLSSKNWKPAVISLSGNTDCYQPAEKKFGLTRSLLEVCNRFNQPVAIITKNAGILRDLPILTEMAQKNIVSVMITITSLDESLRVKMEPRTVTGHKRLKVVEELSRQGIPVGVMMAPIIPGLNDAEIPSIIELAAAAGATQASYSLIRIEGSVKILFEEWIHQHFPDRADKVLHQIIENQGKGIGQRMKGKGVLANLIAQMVEVHKKKWNVGTEVWELDTGKFRRNNQLQLF